MSVIKSRLIPTRSCTIPVRFRWWASEKKICAKIIFALLGIAKTSRAFSMASLLSSYYLV